MKGELINYIHAVNSDSSDVVDIFNEAGISGSIVVYVSGGYWLVSIKLLKKFISLKISKYVWTMWMGHHISGNTRCFNLLNAKSFVNIVPNTPNIKTVVSKMWLTFFVPFKLIKKKHDHFLKNSICSQ